jgi:hypothetical protein
MVGVCLSPAPASAQAAGVAPVQLEEIEPRVIGRPGTTILGLSGFGDRFFSPEESMPTNYTAQIDVSRFLTRRFVVKFGALGSGSFGGDASEDLPVGSGVPAMHAMGGLSYFFTPDAMISVYLGSEYWAPLTQRADRDTGSLLGTAGVQAAVSSRASVFVQGGYGARLNRGEDDEVVTRVVAQIGFRIKL